MSFAFILMSCIAILATLIKKYRVKRGIIRCSKCPFNNSLQCHSCKREFDIKENKYNKCNL